MFSKIFSRRDRAHPAPSSSGAVSSFRHDGIELARLNRKPQGRGVPVREVALIVIAVLCFKMITYADIGPSGYAARMNRLFEGNFMEKVTAQAMKLDPASKALGVRLRRVVRKVEDSLGSR